jgi:hypothetical protein
MNTTPAETYTICIAGDYDDARRACRQWCAGHSQCVTVIAASYVYAWGEEAGVIVTLRSYPRFPPNAGELAEKARALALVLMDALYQRGVMICGPTEHEWYSRDVQTNRPSTAPAKQTHQ